MKQIIIVTLLVVGVIAGAVVFGGKEDTAEGLPSNNYYGLEASEVVITEYGDFECPGCQRFFPIVTEVKEKFKDRIRFEFKHFPLVSSHPNAIAAHRAAEAAGQQDKFWEMHDLLYERQTSWSAASSPNSNPAETFEGYAQELDLDVEQYKLDVRSSETIGTINADIAEGKSKDVSATPTFFLNGEQLTDTNLLATADSFSALIEAKLAENTQSETNSESEEAKPEDQQ